MKRTPLYEQHKSLGGRVIDFGGWELPVQYSSIVQEHNTVREKAGLFDVSHMGEILITGSDAENFISHMVTNNIKKLNDQQIQYTLMCYPDGGVVDDLLVYKFNSKHYLLVVNAANIEKDYDWLMEHKRGDVSIENVSQEYAQIALQGPLAQEILQQLTEVPLDNIKFFYFEVALELEGVTALVSRTGYTGEDGFEIYLSPADAPKLWVKLLEVGSKHGLVPVGLGARDTLRFEAGLPLYGHEISSTINPLEAGLKYFVKLKKSDFIGLEALREQKSQGLNRKLVGFEMVDRGIPRTGYEIAAEGEPIGFVTSGSFSPTFEKSLGLAIVSANHSELGSEIGVIVRGKVRKGKIIKTPFYRKQYKK